MNIKAICTDIDGTLLDSRRELSPRTIATVKSLNKEMPFILASSRMPGAMRHLQEELGILHQPMICFNGGYVLLFNEGDKAPEVADSVQIPVSICSAIVEMAEGTDIHVSLYSEDLWHAPQYDKWTEKEERVTKVTANVGNLAPVIKEWQTNNMGAHKVMCMGPEEEIAEMQKALTKQFGNEIYIYYSRPTYLELAPRTISKATALEFILKNNYGLGMEAVMAFGDNYNDIDMVKAAGKGIAVGNAREEVKAVADEITLNSIEDGVAVAIEKHLL